MLKKHEQAIPHLARFVNEDKESKTRDYAMLLLAQSYEQAGQLDKALETARDALATYPNTQFASQLRGRIASAKRLQGAGADSAEVQAATQPAVTVGSPAPAASPVVPAAVKPAAAPPAPPAAAAPKAH
jgi:tetratricopeptide (TPR) repeat protein